MAVVVALRHNGDGALSHDDAEFLHLFPPTTFLCFQKHFVQLLWMEQAVKCPGDKWHRGTPGRLGDSAVSCIHVLAQVGLLTDWALLIRGTRAEKMDKLTSRSAQDVKSSLADSHILP